MSRNTFVSALPSVLTTRSTTMLPFLYQTRTIASLGSVGKIPVSPYRYTNAIRRRQFSRYAVRCFPDDQRSETPGPEDANKGEGGFAIRRVATQRHSPEPEKFSFSYRSLKDQRGIRDDDESADWEPEGSYGTTKRRGGYGRNMTTGSYNNRESKEIDIPWGETITSDFEAFEEFEGGAAEESDNTYEETADEIENLTRKSSLRQDEMSTITPSERLAFQKIFSDIFARSQSTSPFGPDGLFEEQEIERPREVRTGPVRAQDAARKIIHDATQSQEEVEAAVNRYPPPLRAAAARAMGLKVEAPRQAGAEQESNAVERSEEETKQALEEEKLEQLRKPERDRVEGLMRSARTDFELWAVMQKEVFPLISKLGLEESPEAEEETAPNKTRTRSKKSNSKPKEAAKEKSEQAGIALDSPVDGMSPLEFYGPLYPSYLLLGLRLLDRSFTRPSPLTLAVLPAIKSLGLISHVLGGTSQLYNELLLIHWYRYDDFRGVLDLLNEMEQFGLDWDRETRDAVTQITRVQKVVRDGIRGVALKSLWSLPEFAPGRFKIWQNKIEQALAEEGSRTVSRSLH